MRKLQVLLSIGLLGVFFCVVSPGWVEAQSGSYPFYPADPDHVVRLIFIHHSTGENWLADDYGGLGLALHNSGYFVSDTNYGWGPASIGDNTDIGFWWTWFRGLNSSTYLNALYAESGQHSSYTRLAKNPGGPNQVIMFKSCFPNSALKGKLTDPIPSINSNLLRNQGADSAYHTVANAKGIYIDILNYFKTRQDKLFIAITAPPLIDRTYAANARAFNQWMVNQWLMNYPYRNVFVFDFYNVLTTNGGTADINDLFLSTGNHHRWWQGAIQHKTDVNSPNVEVYPTGDDHPSRAGNLKATAEYIKLLDYAYDRWQDLNGPLDNNALPFSTGGNAGWFGESAAGYYVFGGSAAQSGAISNNQSSWLQTTVKGPGTLKFYWRVSSQANCDFLRLRIDGAEAAKISGNTAWAQVTKTLATGNHTIQWIYQKDASGSGGSDAGWVDKVEWTSP
ncbi:MAG: hypothetical protein ABSG91_11000 [Syntrophobacteraceae bacterium]|jgi:hypothetical protein